MRRTSFHRLLVSFLVLLAFLAGSRANAADGVTSTDRSAPVIDLDAVHAGKIKIACVGDSITEGVMTNNGNSYPEQLQRMLNGKAEVKNFGLSCTTLLRKGDFVYQGTPNFKQALEYKPDIVIIMLGTNDTKPQNWKFKDDFTEDYKDMIVRFAALESKPRILIAKPCVVLRKGAYNIVESGVLDELPMIDKVGAELKISVVDIHGVMAKAALDKPEIIPDSVHPNNEGAAVMASVFFKALCGKDYSGPSTICGP